MNKNVSILLFSLAAVCMVPPSVTILPAQPTTDLQLFHSTHAVNLLTSQTLDKNCLEFEVSHRFVTPITTGREAFFGLDGPANIRLSLAYAPADHLLLTLGRTNVLDNIDFQIKYKAVQIPSEHLPMVISLLGGAAFNSQVDGILAKESKKYQFYCQAVMNTMLVDKIGIGLVPAYLENAYIYCADHHDSFTLGNYLQYFSSSGWSVLAEWIPTVTGWRRYHNTMSLAVEFETGGHFFKIILSNNNQLNPSLYLTGADLNFADRDWRLGFMITRLFVF